MLIGPSVNVCVPYGFHIVPSDSDEYEWLSRRPASAPPDHPGRGVDTYAGVDRGLDTCSGVAEFHTSTLHA